MIEIVDEDTQSLRWLIGGGFILVVGAAWVLKGLITKTWKLNTKTSSIGSTRTEKMKQVRHYQQLKHWALGNKLARERQREERQADMV
eukprot:m.130428 g.130428  ORF g.130428 m.130428 type:complete len:88 (-) comp29477_c0_seq1:96-359(-)